MWGTISVPWYKGTTHSHTGSHTGLVQVYWTSYALSLPSAARYISTAVELSSQGAVAPPSRWRTNTSCPKDSEPSSLRRPSGCHKTRLADRGAIDVPNTNIVLHCRPVDGGPGMVPVGQRPQRLSTPSQNSQVQVGLEERASELAKGCPLGSAGLPIGTGSPQAERSISPPQPGPPRAGLLHARGGAS